MTSRTGIALTLVAISLLTGCIMTRKRGEYVLDVRKTEEARVEVSGYLSASPFIDWHDTRYGAEPKRLVQLLIASLLPGVPPASYEVSDVRFTRYEPGANMIGWSAVVSGGKDVVAPLQSKVGKRIEGDFSFEEERLLQVKSERPYP